MPTLRIPLVGSTITRPSGVFTVAVDQAFTNCYPEVIRNPITGKGVVYLLKRPGTSKGAALTGVDSACPSGAIVSWAGQSGAEPIIAAAFVNTGGTSTSVWNMSTDSKIGGDISNTQDCTCLTETVISGTANLVGNFYDSSTGALEQWFYPESGAWTQVTDADFPSDVVGFPAHMDGFVFNMTKSGKIYNSDLNSVSAYTSTNFIEANDYPDRGVTVARFQNYIVGFGERSIQFFYNAGNATGSILSRVQGATIRMGAGRTQTTGGIGKTTVFTVLPAKSNIYWIGANSEGIPNGIFRFKGLTPEKISTPTIDRALGDGLSGFRGTMFFSGSHHIVLGGAGVTLHHAYCIDTDTWWRFELASGGLLGAIGAASSSLSMSARTHFTTTANARNNVSLLPSGSNNQDDGSNFTVSVQTANDDLGTGKRKFYESARLIGDDQPSTCNVAVSYSDDDYTSFSTARNIDMGTYPSQKLTRLGSSRRRAWKLTNAASTPLRLEALEIDYSVGAT